MKHTILYVGLDVDDTQDQGSAFDKCTGAGLDFHRRPTLNPDSAFEKPKFPLPSRERARVRVKAGDGR